MSETLKSKEELAEKMHIWYLEATKELNPESFNAEAQKEYSELTEEQKFIDRYIANKVLEEEKDFIRRLKEKISICVRGTCDRNRLRRELDKLSGFESGFKE